MNLSSTDHTRRSPATQDVEPVAPTGFTTPLLVMKYPLLVVMLTAARELSSATEASPWST
ncbi:MAG: hypothetical protein ACRCVD_12135 [Halioglobus sp.]